MYYLLYHERHIHINHKNKPYTTMVTIIIIILTIKSKIYLNLLYFNIFLNFNILMFKYLRENK